LIFSQGFFIDYEDIIHRYLFNRMTGILFFLKPCKMIFANVSPNKEFKMKI